MRLASSAFAVLAASLAACAPLEGEPEPRVFDRAAMRFAPVDVDFDLASGVDVTGVWSAGGDRVWLSGWGPRAWPVVGRLTAEGYEPMAEVGEGGFAGPQAVVGAGAEAWAIGDGGISHFDGDGWALQADQWFTYGFGSALWANGRADVWAVGYYGDTWHWDGARWHDRTIEFGQNPFFRGTLTDVWAAPTGEAWVVGEGSTGASRYNAARWDGAEWTVHPLDAVVAEFAGDRFADGVAALWGAAADDVWVAGQNGLMIRWQGEAWTPVPSGTEHDLVAVHGLGPDAIWAVGGGGTILFWDGETWGPVDSGTEADLNDVWAGPDAVWVVGDDDTVLRFDR